MIDSKLSAILNDVHGAAESSEEAASICSNRESSLAEVSDQEILKEVRIDPTICHVFSGEFNQEISGCQNC